MVEQRAGRGGHRQRHTRNGVRHRGRAARGVVGTVQKPHRVVTQIVRRRECAQAGNNAAKGYEQYDHQQYISRFHLFLIIHNQRTYLCLHGRGTGRRVAAF